MVWMQSLMKNGRRRQQSQSPSSSSDSSQKAPKSFFGSKHKRRIFRKDSSVTEAGSMCSMASESAPWRVENIRSGAPAAEEWWEEVSGEAASVGEDEYSEDAFDDRYDTVVVKSLSQKKFHNCGLEAWEKVREEWTRRTVETLPPKPTPAEYSTLVRGLRRHSTQRTYELPRRMALSDLIDVYQDIWDGERGS